MMHDHGSTILVAGSANVDFVVPAQHVPRPGETVLGGDLVTFPGGKGANQAVAAARAGRADVVMLTCLGVDEGAGLITRSLEEAGVRLIVASSERRTGAALITVSASGANAITVAPGANQDLSITDLPTLANVGSLVLQLETPIATVTAFAQRAKEVGVRVLLNAAPAQSLSADLLAAVDVVVVNEEELAMIAGWEGTIVDRLRAIGVATAIVTLGARGCCAVDGQDVLVQPAFVVNPVDTTAAGDTFCGSLAAALNGGEMLPAALRRASAAAALATTRRGAQASIPNASEVEMLLARAEEGAEELGAYCGLVEPSH